MPTYPKVKFVKRVLEPQIVWDLNDIIQQFFEFPNRMHLTYCGRRSVLQRPLLLVLFFECLVWESFAFLKGGTGFRKLVATELFDVIGRIERDIGRRDVSSLWVNETSMFWPVSVLTQQVRPKPTTEGDRSLKRAIEQVHALLELYSSSPDPESSVSSSVVLLALESLISRALQDPQSLDNSLLEELEMLLWRLREPDIDLVPPMQVLESLMMMQNYFQVSKSEPTTKASKLVGRSVRLWCEWREWFTSGHLPESPPLSHFERILDYAIQSHVTMSFALWDLFQRIVHDLRVPRVVYGKVLTILSYSNLEWRLRQSRVLQDMVILDPQSLHPTEQELRAALQAHAAAGQSCEDAAWLMLMLQNTESGELGKLLFLDALLRCNDAGSLLYMERLVQSEGWIDLGPRAYRKLLKKIATSRIPGAGIRAEVAYGKLYRNASDPEAVHHVVTAYLQEYSTSYVHVLQADRFVRQVVEVHGLTGTSDNSHPSRSWNTFERLLDAITSYASANDDAAQIADKLFQFQLLQFRKNRIDEPPTPFHLGHLLRIWNKPHPSIYGARKSYEYHRILWNMFEKGEIKVSPDVFNLRQLLGTLARSNQTGFGEASERLLTIVLKNETLPDPYILGHMFWCTVKCHCNEKKESGIQRAMSVLEKMENLHDETPSVVRLTGAAYQTLLGTLALFDGNKTGEQAALIIDKIEKQHARGNRRAKLRRSLYRDAIRCWERDQTKRRDVMIHKYNEKIQELEERERHPVRE